MTLDMCTYILFCLNCIAKPINFFLHDVLQCSVNEEMSRRKHESTVMEDFPNADYKDVLEESEEVGFFFKTR